MKRETRRPLFATLVELFRTLLGKKREPNDDPFTRRLAPVRRGPKSRGGAAAVAEPEEENRFFPPRNQ